MGKRNTPQQQRAYVQSMRERKRAQGLRPIQAWIAADVEADIERRAAARGESKSDAIAGLIDDGILLRTVTREQ